MSQPRSLSLRGIVPPLVTPLAIDDELDRAGLERLIERVLGGGVSGLFVLGTTGEGPSLPYRTRTELIATACELARGRAPVLVGVTDTSLAEAVEMANIAGEAGADAVVMAPPCYFHIDQEDLERAARRLAAESPLPVMLYNMPSLTKTVFEPETVRRLLDEPKIVGIKDSSGDLGYFRRLCEVRRRRPDWSVMAGPEHLLSQTVALGGDGGVCGGANLFPELFVRLYEASVEEDHAATASLRAVVERLGALYCLAPNPALAVIQGVKAGLAVRGVCSADLCAPFSPLGVEEMKLVDRILDDVDEALTKSPCATMAG